MLSPIDGCNRDIGLACARMVCSGGCLAIVTEVAPRSGQVFPTREEHNSPTPHDSYVASRALPFNPTPLCGSPAPRKPRQSNPWASGFVARLRPPTVLESSGSASPPHRDATLVLDLAIGALSRKTERSGCQGRFAHGGVFRKLHQGSKRGSRESRSDVEADRRHFSKVNTIGSQETHFLLNPSQKTE